MGAWEFITLSASSIFVRAFTPLVLVDGLLPLVFAMPGIAHACDALGSTLYMYLGISRMSRITKKELAVIQVILSVISRFIEVSALTIQVQKITTAASK